MKPVQTYAEWCTENEIASLIVKHMHEGIRMVKTETDINESNVRTFAENEISLLIKDARSKGDSLLIAEFVPEILALIEKFGNSGQSGGSAPYTAGAITSTLKKLLMFQPIAPITGEETEWSDSISKNTFQNNRCYALFKESKNGDPYYLDAIVWKNQKGFCYTGSALLENGKKVQSRQFVKSFPFEPKTFTIDIVEKEVKKDDFEFYVKDEKQLEEVWKYYRKKDI